MNKYFIGGVLCFVTLCIGLVVEFVRFSNAELAVVFCDVGQGDGIVIRTPRGYDMVIDGGPDSSILRCLSSHMPFWDKSLDIVFLTHFDSDHYNGLLDIVDRYDVKTFVTGYIDKSNMEQVHFVEEFQKRGVKVWEMNAGKKVVTPDGVTIHALWPYERMEKGLSDNNTSLVQELSYRNFDILLTGDIDHEYLNPILVQQGKKYEIFKLPHHGSRTGVDTKTLTLIHPDIVISSSGRENRYGHPHKEVVELVEQSRAVLKRTDLEANIVIKSDGEKYWISE